jgi:hypothetical protein
MSTWCWSACPLPHMLLCGHEADYELSEEDYKACYVLKQIMKQIMPCLALLDA